MPAPPASSLARFPAAAGLAACLLAAPVGAQSDPAETADIFPYPVHQTTLDNGLQVVVIPYDSPGIVAYYTVVRTGSRDEVEPGHSGFAHFFEHMMFRGTEKYSQQEYNDALKAMGADSNAFTTDDWTNYYIVGPAAELPTMVDLESDRFMNLEYTEEAFRTEALAVLGEYNKNASNPFRALHEELRELAYEQHTYEHTTMGFLEDIEAMPGYYEYSLGFFDRFYRPENVIVLVAGDVDPERMFALARQHYGSWKAGYQQPEIATEPPQTEPRSSVIEWPNPTRPHVMMAWHVPAFDAQSADTSALDLIAQLLFSENAPLYQELVVDRQLVDFIGGGAGFHRDPYLFTVTTRLRSEESLGEIQATVERYLEQLKSAPVDRARLERTKSNLRYDVALALDSAPAVADLVAEFLNLTGDPQTINRLYARYAAVTPEEIQQVARKYFRPENRNVVQLVHRAAGEDAATPSEGGE